MKRYVAFQILFNLAFILLLPVIQIHAMGVEKKPPQLLVVKITSIAKAAIAGGEKSDELINQINNLEKEACARISNREQELGMIISYFIMIILINILYSSYNYDKLLNVSSNQSLKGRM